jgi:protein involved in polysaccharide export with SLBB domain
MIVASRISGLAAAPSEQATAAAKSESSAASIASAGAYYVIGPGTRSRVYSLTGRQVTLSSALAEAGIPRDQNAAVDLIRRQGNEQITTRLVMADVASGKQQDPVLLPNDLLNVRPITDVCYIVGPVPRPGVFSVVAETNKVSLFLQASGFTLDVNNQPELWLVRQGVASESIDKLPPQTAANMALQAGDILIVGNIPSYDSVASALRPAVAASTDIPARAHSTRRAPVTGEPGSVVGQYTLRGTTRTNGRFMILGRPMTVLQAVAAATLGEGMLWPDRVYVRRQNGITREVRLKSVLIGTDGDSYVQDGDEIAVTSSYSILGENAGTYTMNDGLLSVREALVQAQIFGLPPGKGLSLIRRTSSGKLDSQELKVGADLTGPGSDLKVQVDDILSLSVEKP